MGAINNEMDLMVFTSALTAIRWILIQLTPAIHLAMAALSTGIGV